MRSRGVMRAALLSAVACSGSPSLAGHRLDMCQLRTLFAIDTMLEIGRLENKVNFIQSEICIHSCTAMECVESYREPNCVRDTERISI